MRSSGRTRRRSGPVREAGWSREDEALARLIHELGVLKRVRRSGWWLAGIRDPESVAEHSFRSAAIAYLIAPLEGADPERACALALFHDAAEARTLDLHRLARRYIDGSVAEDRVVRDQTRGLPEASERALQQIHSEAGEQGTAEARVARDADLLECLAQALEYQAQGAPVAAWIKSCVKEISTSAGSSLAMGLLAVSLEALAGPRVRGRPSRRRHKERAGPRAGRADRRAASGRPRRAQGRR